MGRRVVYVTKWGHVQFQNTKMTSKYFLVQNKKKKQQIYIFATI